MSGWLPTAKSSQLNPPLFRSVSPRTLSLWALSLGRIPRPLDCWHPSNRLTHWAALWSTVSEPFPDCLRCQWSIVNWADLSRKFHLGRVWGLAAAAPSRWISVACTGIWSLELGQISCWRSFANSSMCLISSDQSLAAGCQLQVPRVSDSNVGRSQPTLPDAQS